MRWATCSMALSMVECEEPSGGASTARSRRARWMRARSAALLGCRRLCAALLRLACVHRPVDLSSCRDGSSAGPGRALGPGATGRADAAHGGERTPCPTPAALREGVGLADPPALLHLLHPPPPPPPLIRRGLCHTSGVARRTPGDLVSCCLRAPRRLRQGGVQMHAGARQLSRGGSWSGLASCSRPSPRAAQHAPAVAAAVLPLPPGHIEDRLASEYQNLRRQGFSGWAARCSGPTQTREEHGQLRSEG